MAAAGFISGRGPYNLLGGGDVEGPKEVQALGPCHGLIRHCTHARTHITHAHTTHDIQLALDSCQNLHPDHECP